MSIYLVKHTGGCHCGKVRFEVLAKPELRAYDCKSVVEDSVFLTFLEINMQLRSTSNNQFVKGFCVKSSFPFPFFDSCSICVKKGMKPFLIPKGNFKLLQVRNKLVFFPLTRDLLFSENQTQSPTRPRIIKKHIFLLISRILHNFIGSV